MMQEILVYLCVGLAIAFLIKKFFWKKKKKKTDKGCDTDCGCH